MKHCLLLVFLVGLCGVVGAKPHVVIVAAEAEYWTWQTLPSFVQQNFGETVRTTVVTPDPKEPHRLVGLEALEDADLLILSTHRRALPVKQLAAVKAYLSAGKPLVAVRTASHGFSLRSNQKAPAGHVQWPEFDPMVLGGNYNGHGPSTVGTIINAASAKHPILGGVRAKFYVRSWLYHVTPVAKDVTVLQSGISKAGGDAHPVTWTRAGKNGGKIFYTSLGHPEDFLQPDTARLFRNAICWALGRKIPSEAAVYDPWGAYWEADQPVISATVDARGWAHKDNLTVRGQVIRIRDDLYACYDTDMVRLAAVWKGAGINDDSMSATSYRWAFRGRKIPGGQKKLPKPEGVAVTELTRIPGVGPTTVPMKDTRPVGKDPKEIGRGPIDATFGRWLGRYDSPDGPVVSYEAAGVRVDERLVPWNVPGAGYLRALRVAANKVPLVIRLAAQAPEGADSKAPLIRVRGGALKTKDGVSYLEIPVSEKSRTVIVGLWRGDKADATKVLSAELPEVKVSTKPGPARWAEEVSTRSRIKTSLSNAYEINEIPIPTPNPFRRNVRLVGIDFFKNGSAAVATFDGDVWLVNGLDKGLRSVKWKRFAAGLFEPLNVAVVDEKIMIATRNGLIRLHDLNNDRQADFYETFCNRYSQSPETREFALSLAKKPGGGFYVSKGAQNAQTQSLQPGTVLEVSADGKTFERFASGLREPFLGIHPKTGVVVASDQQGPWVPSTPVHRIDKGKWYGFFSKTEKVNDRVPQQPLMWHPHFAQSSGVGMIWADEKRFGPLSGQLIGFDYKHGSVVVMDWQDDATVSAGWKLDGQLQGSPLHAAVNPKDGQVYVTGFSIWDSARPALSSLARIRYKGGDLNAPVAAQAFSNGMLVRMGKKINAKQAIDRANYLIERWDYKRSNKYGSGHYLPGQTENTGQEGIQLESVTVDKDGKSVFLRFKNEKNAMQLKADLTLAGKDGKERSYAVWTSVGELPAFVPKKFGFPALRPPEKGAVGQAGGAVVSAANGKKAAEQFGCIACHSIDGTTAGKTGPSWKGIYQSRRPSAGGGGSAVADDGYLRTSITDPTAFVLQGYDVDGVGMPAYAGVLKPHQIQSIVEYIKTLK